MTIKSDLRAIARLAGDPDAARPALASGALPVHGGYPLRGRWLSEPYTRLRNAAWLVRNSRQRSESNPIALQVVVQEAEKLVAQGESIFSVFEAFAELLRVP